MSLMCEYCNKNFNSKSNLTRHQKTTKSCILIQKEKFNIGVENSLTYSCKYCNKNFTSKQGLNSHLGICSSKQGNDIFQEKYSNISKKYDKTIKEKDIIIDELRREILVLKTKNDMLERHMDRSTSTVEEIAKQPRNQTNNTQNKIIITTPLDLSKESILSAIENSFNDNYLVQGQKGIARFAYDTILKDEQGELKYICTDPSRQIFQYKNSEGEIKKDVKATKLTKALLDAELKTVSHKIAWDNMKNGDDVSFSKYTDHYHSIQDMESDNCEFSKELSCLATK